MAEETDDAKLSAEHSPKTVDMRKKRARKINNWPLFIALMVVGVIILTLGLVVVKRSGDTTADADIFASGVKRATSFAHNFMSPSGGGIVGPKMPAKPSPAEIPSTIVQLDSGKEVNFTTQEKVPELAAARKPEIPRMNDELKRVREMRVRQAEAAIDGPIKVQLDEIKTRQSQQTDELARIDRQLASLGSGSMTYEQRLAAAQAAINGGSGSGGYDQRNDLTRLNQFASADSESGWTNPARVEAPSTPFIIRAGAVIPSVLESEIISDLPGQIKGRVSQAVYDSPTGEHLLIPQNSTLIGEYSSQIAYGQSALFVVWKRIEFPDGKVLDLGGMPGASGSGSAGFKDRVNNHYLRIFGSAIMMSAIVAGVEMSQDGIGGSDSSDKQRMADAISESLGQNLGGVMAEMISRNMSIAPTLEIRRGYRFNVMLIRDLLFDGPYREFDY